MSAELLRRVAARLTAEADGLAAAPEPEPQSQPDLPNAAFVRVLQARLRNVIMPWSEPGMNTGKRERRRAMPVNGCNTSTVVATVDALGAYGSKGIVGVGWTARVGCSSESGFIPAGPIRHRRVQLQEAMDEADNALRRLDRHSTLTLLNDHD